jgi:hypothetical protein
VNDALIANVAVATADFIVLAVNAHDTMYNALQLVLAWLTNVNTCEPGELVRCVMGALESAGMSKDDLDIAAIAMLRGAAALALAEGGAI